MGKRTGGDRRLPDGSAERNAGTARLGIRGRLIHTLDCDVAVVGAGISGLSAAWSAHRAGAAVLVLESSGRSGGVIATSRVGVYLLEQGPATVVVTPAVSAMIEALGLQDATVRPSLAARERFIVRDGKLHAVPLSPLAILSTPLLSIQGKVRALCEPFVRRRAPSSPEESLAGLVRRRFGDEVLQYLIDPLVGGVYAGDVEQLSATHSLAMLATLERQYGSILVGALRQARNRGGAPGSATRSFTGGMQQLPDAIAQSLGSRVRLAEEVVELGQCGSAWELTTVTAGGTRSVRAKTVVLTVPAHRLRDIVMPSAIQQRLERVKRIPYVPMATMALGFRRGDVRHPLNGFGMLVPFAERAPILGALFSSTMFPERSVHGDALLTCFAGGGRIPVASNDDVLIRKALDYLTPLLGITGAPTLSRVTRWEHAIPQPHVGHDEVLRLMAEVENEFPGLLLTGSYRHGVSLGDCLSNGADVGTRAFGIASRAFPS